MMLSVSRSARQIEENENTDGEIIEGENAKIETHVLKEKEASLA